MITPRQGEALLGVGVLVTRPVHQAAALCRLLEAEGAATFRLAVIEIRPTAPRGEAAARATPSERLDPLARGRCDLVVFTSANAVRFGAALLDGRRDLALAAIGPATARELDQAGYRVSVQPHSDFDSEALLAHPSLQHPAGCRILIVKGRGGRSLLERELASRGATVETLDVYERVAAHPSAAQKSALIERMHAGEVHVVTATSLEIAGRLLDAELGLPRPALERLHWLVAGPRIAAGLRELGVTAPLIAAASAEDHALVEALVAWRAAESGA